jgi:chemotaxis protein MotB
MKKKHKHPEHVNHERWLISYADFITLLFAFFVVMFAVSQTDQSKAASFSESFSDAVGLTAFPHNGHGIMQGAPATSVTEATADRGSEQQRAVDLEELYAVLRRATTSDGMSAVQVIRRRNEFVLRMPENIFFDSGDYSLKAEAIPMLRTITDSLRQRSVDIRVEGHTDNRPIHTARFRSNWDLSTARATAVLTEILVGNAFPPDRMSAAGYGEFHPIASNDTDLGRQQNRRVDLVVSLHANTGDAGLAPQPADPFSDLAMLPARDAADAAAPDVADAAAPDAADAADAAAPDADADHGHQAHAPAAEHGHDSHTSAH